MADYPRVTHPCAAPTTEYCYPVISARLACLIHAASVRSEPESNSPLKNVSFNSCPMISRTNYNFKTLHRHPLTGCQWRGSHLSHNSIFNEQSGVATQKNLVLFEGLFPDLGDKKPESRLSLYNSASQTFVCYATSFTRIAPTVNDLLFTSTVAVVRTWTKYPSRKNPQEFFSFF